jgi:5'(3')-deoxyribonucleotidase
MVMNDKNKLTILLDMDGVIVDLFKSMCNIHNLDKAEVLSKCKPDTWDILEILEMSWADFWNPIDNEGTYFWANARPYPWTDMLVQYLESKGQIVICTTLTEVDGCRVGKLMWLAKYLPKSHRVC